MKPTKKEFTLNDWLSAGYKLFTINSDSKPNESSMLMKNVVDGNGKDCYLIMVGVFDYAEFYGEKVAMFGISPKVSSAPARWEFAPRVKFSGDSALEVSINTFDPAVAEEKLSAIWAAIGKPYND